MRRMVSRLSFPLALAALSLFACRPLADEAADPIDECATCDGGKADGLTGACEGSIIVRVANESTFDELDLDAGLNARAAEAIVAARASAPFATIEDVDAVPFVGVSSLEALLAYGTAEGLTCDEVCELDVVVVVANQASLEELDDQMRLDSRAANGIILGRPFETIAEVDAVSFVGDAALVSMREFGETRGLGCDGLGIISDLDKTVIPPSPVDLEAAPYPGVVTLYSILLRGSARLTYVTARSPDRVVGVPSYLAAHGLPTGPIETGISGIPSIARREKVADITRAFEAHPSRQHVLFGDTSHVDPEVSRDILATFPTQVRVGLIHLVTETVSEDRLDGLRLHHNYAEAAAILAGLGVISEAEAREVFAAATSEGLELTEAAFEDLLAANEI
jgi:DNA uptake protein ComE-like DNA-binding protein